MPNEIVLAITGPAGAGKSTVAHEVAKKLLAVNIDVDSIKHMIVAGFYYTVNPAGEKVGRFSEWELLGDSVGMLVENFLHKGYSVIINGYIDEPAWESLQKHVILTHKVLLLPNLETVIKRDAWRSGDVRMGPEAIREHFSYFSSAETFQDFTKLDTSDLNVEEAVKEILKIVAGKSAN